MVSLRFLFTALLLFFSLFVSAQKYDYNWCFLDSFRLDFNSTLPQIFFDVSLPPTSISDGVKGLIVEANLSLSDNKGNLLFYLNPGSWLSDSVKFGKPKFLDKNGKAITNGTNIKVESSSTNGAIIFPVKDNAYICVTHYSDRELSTKQIYYHIIEHDVSSGKCNVKEKNKLLISGSFAEKLAVVKHQNNHQWWVIFYEINKDSSTNGFHIYSVDDRNIQKVKKINIGSLYNGGERLLSLFEGEICFSPQGDKLVVVNLSGLIDLFDFDRCTGTLSNWQPLGKIVPSGSIYKPAYYGCAFSPDGSKTYITSGSKLLQFDLSSSNIKESVEIIKDTIPRSSLYLSSGQLELAPDEKIYYPGFSDFWVIKNPNQKGKACNFEKAPIDLKGKYVVLGLPNFPNYRIPDIVTAYAGSQDTFVICEGESVKLGVTPVSPKLVYEWSPPLSLDDSLSATPIATPSKSTAYVLTVRPHPATPETCRSRPFHQDTVWVIVKQIDKPAFITDTCFKLLKGDSLTLDAQNTGASYHWSTGDTTRKITLRASGKYRLTIEKDSCSRTDDFCVEDSIIPPLPPKPEINIPNIFTPNNDGINDTWDINLIGFHLKNIVIFDRWGIIVYSGNTLPITWNPKVEGVYFYHLEIEGQNEILRKSGNITVLK